MNNLNVEFTEDFNRDLKKLKKKKELMQRLNSKIIEIQKNPYHYKILRNVLKNRRRTHIDSFVLTFEVKEKESIIAFHSFQHHDDVYS